MIALAKAPAPATTTNPGTTVNKLVTTFMTNQNIPGIAVALYYQNKTYLYNYGITNLTTQRAVTSDTIFELGSVTKVFTATLLAKQILADKMALKDKVTQYLPTNVKNSNGPINQVTLQELATHTSGLPSVPPGLQLRDRPSYSKTALMDFVAHWQPDVTIGSEYSYSNIGFGLLGYALETVSKQSYAQLLQSNIFDPLGMRSSSLNNPIDESRYADGYNQMGQKAIHWPKNAWPAGGAIRSTATDMLKFLQANLGIATSGASPQLIQAMKFAQKGIYQTDNFNQGLAWSVNQNGFVVKGGGTAGFSSFIALFPGKRMGVVVLTNKTGVKPGKLANQILLQLSQ
jgi:beta-lactamase class C